MKEVTELTIWKLNKPVLESKGYDLWGIDPGTQNLGLAWTTRKNLCVAQVKIVRNPDPVSRIKTVNSLLHALSVHAMFSGAEICQLTVIEGASFGDRYRQVELAEQRASIVNWILNVELGAVRIVPPLSIRKKVLGSAKLKAQDVWDNSEIPNDALAAYSCLLYADNLAANGLVEGKVG